MSAAPTCSRYVGERVTQQSAQDEFLLPLEALLASVTVMHPTRLCDFICKIIQQFEHREEDYKTFINELDNKARDQGVLGEHEDWKIVMDSFDKFQEDEHLIPKQRHCYFLTTTYDKKFYKRRGKTKIRYEETAMEKFLNLSTMEDVHKITTSVFKLLKYMRNKIEHFKDFPPAVQKALGWGIEKNNKIILNDCLFVNYWSLRFPKLFSFVWKDFFLLKEELELHTFYPSELTMHMPTLDITLPGFVTNLNNALLHHMENRGLNSYYINEDTNIRVEFRHLSSALQVAAPYDHSSEVYVRVSNEGVKTVFKKDEEISVSYNSPGDRKSLAIMVKLTGLGVESDFLRQCIDCERIIVLLHNPEDKDRVLVDIEKICNLKLRPALWDDLNNSEKNIIVHRFVEVQGKTYKLFKILPERFNRMDAILSSLDANELQSLLQNLVPTVFPKCILPKIDEIYIERQIVQANNGLDTEQEQLNIGIQEIDWFAKENTHASLMFLCDKPGQGKTTFTSSFANKTSKFLVLHLTAKKFALQLSPGKQNNVNTESIIDAFTKIFCLSHFEKALFENILNGYVSNKKVLILIDALDEADSKSVEPIFNALSIIRNHFPTVQVLVTMRVHLLNQAMKQITDAAYYRLTSFSDKDKIQYLTQYWDNYIKDKRKKDTNIPAPNPQKLSEFARRCTEIQVPEEFQDVLGLPLQCRMIAEIHAENLLNRNFSLAIQDFGNVTKYFEKYLDSKCEIYFREKNQMSGDDLVNSPLFKRKRKEMLTLHVYYALKLFHWSFTSSIVLFKDKFIPQFDIDTETDLLTFGIVKTLKPLQFIHVLIAEYLAALFYKELVSEGGIYHSMFSQFKQKSEWGLIDLFGYYLSGWGVDHESVHEPSFKFEHPTAFKFLKYLSQEQSKSVVNPRHVYPIFSYTADIDKLYFSYFKNAESQDDHHRIYYDTVSQECELKFNELLGYYIDGSTRFGELIYRQGFEMERPNVYEFLEYLSDEDEEDDEDSEDIYPMRLYRLENVALQEYYDRGLLPDIVYTKIIEILNVVQGLSSTVDFYRICIDVTEDKKGCEFHVDVEHIH